MKPEKIELPVTFSQLPQLDTDLLSAHLKFSWRGRFVVLANGKQAELDELTRAVLKIGNKDGSSQYQSKGKEVLDRLRTLYTFSDHAFKQANCIVRLAHQIRVSKSLNPLHWSIEPIQGPRHQLESPNAQFFANTNPPAPEDLFVDIPADEIELKNPEPYLRVAIPCCRPTLNLGPEIRLSFDHSDKAIAKLPVTVIEVSSGSPGELNCFIAAKSMRMKGTTLKFSVYNQTPVENFRVVWNEDSEILYFAGGEGMAGGLTSDISDLYQGTQLRLKYYQQRFSVDLAKLLKARKEIKVYEYISARYECTSGVYLDSDNKEVSGSILLSPSQERPLFVVRKPSLFKQQIVPISGTSSTVQRSK